MSMDFSSPVSQILLLLAAAVIVVAFFSRLKLSPVLGYLVAGAVLGPYGIGIIQDEKDMVLIAEFGVVFLLFIVGTELSFSRMREMKTEIFGFGGAQVLLTGGIIAFAGLQMGLQPEVAILIGLGLALSSTALVLQLLDESKERDTQLGRVSLAVLLLQDLAVVPLLVLVPLLGADPESIGTALLNAGARAVIAMVVVVVAGKLFLRPMFQAIAGLGQAEIFSAFTLLVVLGISWGFHAAGLSMALGAFVAGLLVAETEFKHQVEADILPYKGLFMGLFFMVVGMSVDFSLLLTDTAKVAGLVLALMAGKAVLIMMLSRMAGFKMTTAILTGLLLSQGGEFAFIVFGLARDVGLMEDGLTQLLMLVVTISMALTPLAIALGKVYIGRTEKKPSPLAVDCEQDTLDLERHVLILGFGRVGQTIGKMLSAEGINYIALDTDPYIVTHCRHRGKPIYYGDATRREVLNAVSVQKARAAVVTVNDFYLANKTVIALKHAAPDLYVIARSHDLKGLLKLEEAGADMAISEMFEGSLQLGSAVLRQLNVPDHEANRITDLFRERDYALTHANIVARENDATPKNDSLLFRNAEVSGVVQGK
jgi:monovalent cation:H+ antiporter-2, CPA2 family